MRNILAVTTTAMALVLGASAASAQDKGGMYMTTDSSGNRMVMGGDMSEGAPVLSGSNGAAPSDCPAGSYYENGQNQIIACEGNTTYTLSEPEAGTMMPSGEAYPEGSMLLSSGDDNEVDGGANPSGTVGQGSGTDDTGTRNDGDADQSSQSDNNDGSSAGSDGSDTGGDGSDSGSSGGNSGGSGGDAGKSN